MSQQSLFQTEPPKRAFRRDDYLDLFADGRVMPTPNIDCIEQGDNLLFIVSMRDQGKIMPKQRQIWNLLVRHGAHPDAPGNITVVCVWGLGKDTLRTFVVFDAYGEHENKNAPLSGWRTWLRNWFEENKDRRR